LVFLIHTELRCTVNHTSDFQTTFFFRYGLSLCTTCSENECDTFKKIYIFLTYRIIMLSCNYRFFTSCRPCYRINVTHVHAQRTIGGKWQMIVKSDKIKTMHYYSNNQWTVFKCNSNDQYSNKTPVMKPVEITIFCFPDCRVEGNIRKVSHHKDTSFLGFIVSSSKFWDGSQFSSCYRVLRMQPCKFTLSQIVRNWLSFQISYDRLSKSSAALIYCPPYTVIAIATFLPLFQLFNDTYSP